ncbi:hypothetical protein [Clostridium sp.]|uniref:hypothetical protein n=1 Tax=Clostridium sp. TaxID=1506 RepID=UPI002FC942D9
MSNENININESSLNLENTTENVAKETKKNFRDCIYGNIDVSLESMDKFIIGIVSLLVISIFIGIVV